MTNNKILIVDDNEQITDLLKEILEIKNYEVFVAATKSEAVEIYRDNDIETVITDLKLAENASGLDVIKEMKQIKNAIFIVSSGYASAGDSQSMTEMGIKGFLPKPFVFNDLFKLLES